MTSKPRHRGCALILFLLATLRAAIIWLVRGAFPRSVTAPARYAEILQAWQAAKPTYIAHFPPAVPLSASRVRMHFQPGALQGATMFEIAFILPAAEFAAEAARARALAQGYTRNPSQADYSYVTFLTDREGASPTRLSLAIGGADAMDRWGITIDPARGEVCYWVIDD